MPNNAILENSQVK